MKLRFLEAIALVLSLFPRLEAQNTISGIVNDYTAVTSFSNCDKSVLQVVSAAEFAPGDKVLLIQMKGATVNLTNTADFGNIIIPGNAGNFEMNRIKSIAGNQITLLFKTLKGYNVSGKVQLVRVPEYDNVTADGLTCKPWDGTTGGVLVIDVSGKLTLQGGGADVSARGFNGGIVADADFSVYHETEYFYPNDPVFAAAKGEGISEIPLNQAYGRGKAANGGGGGNAHNGGGGGGSNAGAGGDGGLEYWVAPNMPTLGTNGVGGMDVFGLDGTKATLGGGGGAGHANDGVGSSGGNGGGIIILKASSIEVAGGNTTVAANGGDVITAGNNNNDGQGGGGAGGCILIQTSQITGALNCELKGGRGGDCLFFVQEQIIGPGGGGGGGKLMLSQNFPNVTANLTGGINGIANQSLANGALPGKPGITLHDVSIPEATGPGGIIPIEQNITFCPGSSVTLNGITYTQPATVMDTIPGVAGCDTVLTYHLQYSPYDYVFQIDGFSCSLLGKVNMTYSLCNLGSSPFPLNPINVTFYDANPLTGPANIVGNFSTVAASADSCLTETIFDIAQFLLVVNGTTLYSVVNFDGSLPTPFSFDDFPVTNLEECNYTNNLDSFVVQLPTSPTLDLGADVILCVDSTVVFDAGAGFSAYLWQDGSTAPTFAATDPGVYWVEVTDSCGYKQRDSVLLTISLLPDTQFPDISICEGDLVALSLPGFDSYTWAPATGLSCTDCANVTIEPIVTTTYTLLATTIDGCVLNDTFTITVLPTTAVSQTLEFCPGESVTIGGVVYSQPGTVVDTTVGPNGCDFVTTYTLVLLPQPVRNEVIEFCKGDTIIVAGTAYTQPGTVVDTIPASTGCDTIVTYTLQYLTDPNSALSLDCPNDININIQGGAGPVAVNYDSPDVVSDCPCPGINLARTSGLASGALFPVATTAVCYQAQDSCGNTATCCFNVTVQEEGTCDVKELGCMKYELLSITRNASTMNLTYRIRVTNKCADGMIYTAIQLPNGVKAKGPADNSVYTAPSGRKYDVRNPNFSPFYSIRFKSIGSGIANGTSDILEYTLPPQVNPSYIHVTARVYPKLFYEAHLNTFYCPVDVVQSINAGPDFSSAETAGNLKNLKKLGVTVFPNPTSGILFADLSDWRGEQVQIQVFDSQGQRILDTSMTADGSPQAIDLPESVANGLYFLEIRGDGGEKQSVRFVVQR